MISEPKALSPFKLIGEIFDSVQQNKLNSFDTTIPYVTATLHAMNKRGGSVITWMIFAWWGMSHQMLYQGSPFLGFWCCCWGWVVVWGPHLCFPSRMTAKLNQCHNHTGMVTVGAYTFFRVEHTHFRSIVEKFGYVFVTVLQFQFDELDFVLFPSISFDYPTTNHHHTTANLGFLVKIFDLHEFSL